MTGRLRSIEIEGFTSIRSAEIDLGALNVLVGANGAGKSNFVHAFELLGRIADRRLGLFVGLSGGASALLHHGAEEKRIGLSVRTTDGDYHAVLVPAADDELIFDSGHRESQLRDKPILELLQACRVFHFQDTSRDAPVKQKVPTADSIALRDDAGNLAAVLLGLQSSEDTQERAAYQRIVRSIRLIAPFFDDFVLVPESSDRVLLRWRQQGSDAVFSANQMSDGTLRFVCLVTLLQQPNLPAVVVLDEPELGLHPSAIVLLADLIKQASARSQVLLATQSVTLMNQFSVQDLIVVERDEHQGGSVFTRPDPERLRDWLDEYSLGELWEKHVIGGQPGTRGSITDA